MAWLNVPEQTAATHKYWVTVGGERGRELLAQVGTICFPVENPDTGRIRVEGIGEIDAYFLERSAVAPEVMDRLITWACQKWNMPQEHILAKIEAAGFPIRAINAVLTVLP